MKQREQKSRISRRGFIGSAAAGLGAAASPTVAREPPSSTQVPGKPMSEYGLPSPHESSTKRIIAAAYPEISPGTGVSRTPLHLLDGMITPNGLHFERHHNGVPDIDAKHHQLLVHGLVEDALTFSSEDLMAYPRVSRVSFIECAGNSGANGSVQPPQSSAGAIHGLLSCSEWTGVPLRIILDEAKVRPEGKWLIAEGADAASLSRSIPLAAARENAILALYQNGERLRPEQGYPLRFLMPGWEGNLNIKWLHRIKVTDGPVNARDETSKYTILQPGGRARQFDLVMGVKSVILRPSVGMTIRGPGFYQISGVAWSGHGRIARVDISTDGGENWRQAELDGPILPQALTRFRSDWKWDGHPTIIQSRAMDEKENVQPTRAELMARRVPGQIYHYNAVQSWQVTSEGGVRNVYA